jgi:hypothetical protein
MQLYKVIKILLANIQMGYKEITVKNYREKVLTALQFEGHRNRLIQRFIRSKEQVKFGEEMVSQTLLACKILLHKSEKHQIINRILKLIHIHQSLKMVR